MRQWRPAALLLLLASLLSTLAPDGSAVAVTGSGRSAALARPILAAEARHSINIRPLSRPAGPELTLAQYRAALLKARALLLESRGEPVTAALRDHIAVVLPLQAQVRMRSGDLVSVDNRPLLRLLAAPPEPYPTATIARREGRSRWPVVRLRRRPSMGRWRLVAALDQLLSACGSLPASSHGRVADVLSSPSLDAAAADRVLRQVLARPEYQYQEQKPSLIERFFDWLGDLLARFFNWLGHLLERMLPASERTPRRADQLARLMVIGVVLLLAVLIARIILVALPNLRRRRSTEAELPSGELLVPREPEALLAEAEREAAAGHYREALRLAYLATVARLDRAGVLPEDRSRTHWELLRDLRRVTRDGSPVTGGGTVPPPPSLARTPATRVDHSPLVTVFAPLTQRLDERLFGGRTATVEDYQAGRAAHDQIERLLCAPA